MQTISGKIMKIYNKFVGKAITREYIKRGNEKFLTREIIENLKEAEKEIEEGKLIQAKNVFQELRDIYGY